MLSTLPLLVAFIGAAPEVDYARDIKPLLKHRCYACHGSLAQKAKLRLDSGAFIRQGGKHGSAIDLVKPAESLLLDRVTRNAEEEGGRMPPDGPPLTGEEVAKLRSWIASGAKVPADDQAEADPRDHWAFRPIIRPALPPVQNAAWARTPVDAFVAAEQERRGLRPSAPADRATLLRRVFLDLIGLPPTPEEMKAFLADDATDAYEKVVDHLLARPEYGERWARHWMDVWRYSDWYGRRVVPDNLNSYGMIWRWRDWIIRSLNEDRGYDWMVRMMLAADELAPGDDSQAVATGFILRNFYRWNYNSWMKDQVEHTGKAFLGLTMNCCQCHDHKYDPITQEEYFKLRAVFEPIEVRHDRVPGEPDPGVFEKYKYGKSYGPIKAGLARVMDEKLDARTLFYTGGEERNVVAGKPPIPPGTPAALGGGDLECRTVELPVESWAPALKPALIEESLRQAAEAVASAEAAAAPNRRLGQFRPIAGLAVGAAFPAAEPSALLKQRLLEARAEAARRIQAALLARLAADRARYPQPTAEFPNLAKVASLREREAALAASTVQSLQAELNLATLREKPPADAAAAKTARDKAIAERTKAATALAAAHAALAKSSDQYTALGPIYPKQSTGRRSALAHWITDRKNPLTARVAANYLWGWHFGRPIVESTHDLGRNGKTPSHPLLIDWLAAELMDNGWRMKHLHRVIVLSNTYRQTSRIENVTNSDPVSNQSTIRDPRSIDPDNVYLWRFPPQRLQAEVVRDSILAVAGSLDRTIGGAPLTQDKGLTVPRRSLYFEHHGEAKMQFLELFDAANACDCYRRSTSVLPQQALALSNGALGQNQSRWLASRLAQSGQEPSAFVQAAFERILNRPPTPAERAASIAFLERQAALFRSVNAKALAALGPSSTTDPAARARENLVLSLLNHTDFVTLR